MRLHVLVEGPSDEGLLAGLFPRLLPAHVLKVIVHQGKGKLSPTFHPERRGLLDQLVPKLRAYGRTLNPATDRVLVLVDADEDDCVELKESMVAKLDGIDPRPVVLFRIAVEESEAFYLGDRRAIKTVFPQANFQPLRNYQQDSVVGTWELFQAVIGTERTDKVGWARLMGPHLSIETAGGRSNRSASFHQLRQGLLNLAGELEN